MGQSGATQSRGRDPRITVIRYLSCDGDRLLSANWQETSIPIEGQEASFISLAVDQSNNPHIAYCGRRALLINYGMPTVMVVEMDAVKSGQLDEDPDSMIPFCTESPEDCSR